MKRNPDGILVYFWWDSQIEKIERQTAMKYGTLTKWDSYKYMYFRCQVHCCLNVHVHINTLS